MKGFKEVKQALFILYNQVLFVLLLAEVIVDYLIAADFECNSGNKGFVLNEIIEFALVLIDAKTFQIVNEFVSFVKPTYHPRLT